MGLLAEARGAAGLSQEELARRAHTSRTTLSAYENGRKSPTLTTMERLLAEAGYRLSIENRIDFAEVVTARGRTVWVPNHLPRLMIHQAMATVVLPLHLNWSTPGVAVDLSDPTQRARCYEIVLREGGPEDIITYVDGALLVDLWDKIVLPRDIRHAWDPVVGAAVSSG